jgi:hypothetical protein
VDHYVFQIEPHQVGVDFSFGEIRLEYLIVVPNLMEYPKTYKVVKGLET